jgi:hypothetical protein
LAASFRSGHCTGESPWDCEATLMVAGIESWGVETEGIGIRD